MKSIRRQQQLAKKRAARKARFTKSAQGKSDYAKKSQFLKKENHRRKKAMGKDFTPVFGFDYAPNEKPWK